MSRRGRSGRKVPRALAPVWSGLGFLIAAAFEALFVHQTHAGQRLLLTMSVIGVIAILAGVGLELERRVRLRRARDRTGPDARESSGSV